MPTGNAPAKLASLVDKVYTACQTANPSYSKGRCMATAWTAAKNAGWFKKGDEWRQKREESQVDYYNFIDFWRRIEYGNFGNREGTIGLPNISVTESMVPFKARILLAVPGQSLNNRIYPKETLEQCAPQYEGKPFILDHDIEHAERVVGIIGSPRYATERSSYFNEAFEGLWGDAVGYMDRDLFQKMQGTRLVPPLIRGVSIGGQGDGEYNVQGGVLIKNFNPAELSVTAFPGIPKAHVAEIQAITESYRQQGLLRKTSHRSQNMEVVDREIPLVQAQAQGEKEHRFAGAITEGPLPPADNADSTRSLRGTTWALNDTRPGLPTPNIRIPVTHVTPQATTSVQQTSTPQADPNVHDSGLGPTGTGPTGTSYPKMGTTTTETPGFGNMAASGTGMPEQYDDLQGYEQSRPMEGTGRKGDSWDAKPFGKIKIPKTGRTTTMTPGFGKMGPSGAGITGQQEATIDVGPTPGRGLFRKKGEEEEEEEERQQRVTMSLIDTMKQINQNILYGKKARVYGMPREDYRQLGDQSAPIYIPPRAGQLKGQSNMVPYLKGKNTPPGSKAKRPMVVSGSEAKAPAPEEEEEQEEEKAIVTISKDEMPDIQDEDEEAKVKAEDEEEEEEESYLLNRLIKVRTSRLARREASPGQEPRLQPKIPKTPAVGYSTTRTKGFGKLSPSGTGLKDQDEEEEDNVGANPVRAKKGEEEEEEEFARFKQINRMLGREQGGDGVSVDKDVKPEGEEEEEERFTAQDVIPMEARAPAIPYEAGMRHAQMIRSIHPSSPTNEQVNNMINMWSQARNPPPAPLKKVRIRADKVQESYLTRGVPTSVPTIQLPGVPVRAVASTGAGLPAIYSPRSAGALMEHARAKLVEIQKRPFGAYNPAGRAYRELLGEILEVR